MITAQRFIFVIFCFSLSPTAAFGITARDQTPLKIKAVLALLPKTEPCNGRLTRVTALYRVEKVLQGKYKHKTILVVHRCPEIPRGPAQYGRGDIGALKPGQHHVLTLYPLESDVKVDDRFPTDKRTRYKAYQTDVGPKPPLIVVNIEGGGGAKNQLRFDGESIVVGRAMDADITLRSSMIADRQLRLQVKGDKIEAQNLSPSRKVMINKTVLVAPRQITCRDLIKLGPYTLRVSLFLKPPPE